MRGLSFCNARGCCILLLSCLALALIPSSAYPCRASNNQLHRSTKSAAFISSLPRAGYATSTLNTQPKVTKLNVNVNVSARTTTRTPISNEDAIRLAKDMKDRAANEIPFTSEEIDAVLTSLRNVDPGIIDGNGSSIDWEELEGWLRDVAHLSHKDWERTGINAERLHQILLGGSNSNSSTNTNESEREPSGLESNGPVRSMLDRVLREGNWEGAFHHTTEAASKNGGNGDDNAKPWVVLVTGLNGIRKTTSIYQDWFPDLLSEALVPPTTTTNNTTPTGSSQTTTPTSTTTQQTQTFPLSQLPCGDNSFFRQLDHMMSILVNDEFQRLYQLTDVGPYAILKDGIFTRYRTLAELLGVVLIREAQRLKLNILVETSGKDVAMFDYVDTFFPDNGGTTDCAYHKLVLHFAINDIGYAERSVDARMAQEILDGRSAVTSQPFDIRQIINANAGGPYGSEVLKSVLSDSDAVWEQIVKGEVEAGKSWYKASIQIEANNPPDAWWERAVKEDGTLGDTTFSFPVR